MSEQLNLAQRIAKASATVGGKLQTDKKNKQDNYDYISSDKILAVVGQAMADCGVVVFPAVVEHDLQLGQSSGGKTRYDVRVKFDMTISDGVSTMTMPWFGVGADYAAPDKATYKAITSGHKYFLAKLFCIGVGNEDGEHESEEPTQSAQQAKRQPQVVEQRKAVMLEPAAEKKAAYPVEWKTPADAQAWAVSNNHCSNEFEAKASFKNSLKEVTGQDKSLDSNHLAAVLENFYKKHMARQNEQQLKAA
jgi:hypothetical protein